MSKILIVEDEPVDQKLAHLVLTSGGHTVTHAEAVVAAMQEVRESEPEVILLDLRLQGDDGLDIARQLKSDPKTRHIAIVAVTAFPDRFTRDEAMAAGCDGYIRKPINTRTLTQEVNDALARSR